MEHHLKILPEYYIAVREGIKKFEVRKDDRPFEVGDILILHEINCGIYTGRVVKAEITYILRDPAYVKEGYCVLSIKAAYPQTVKQLFVDIKAKGKEFPEKVIFEGDGYDDEGDLIYDIAYCPICNHKYEVDYDEHDNYCRNCGQMLDWNYEKEEK